MQQTKIALLRLDYLLGAAIIFCQVLGAQQLTSVLFYISFFVSAALWVCTTTEPLDKLDCLAVAIVLLAFVHVAINAALTGANISFEYLKKYIMFCCSVIFLSAIRRITLDRATFRFLEALFLLVGAFMLFMYLFRNQQMHLLKGQYTRYLTFRFTNPNLTALFLSCMMMFLEVAAFQEKCVPVKILMLAMAAAELVFLYQTESRNALLAVVVFTVFSAFFFLRKKHITFRKSTLWFAAVLPLLFAIVYLYFVDSTGFAKIFSFIAGEGKKLNSRTKIWQPAFREFAVSPIFGAYYQVSGGTGNSQLHNTHVDVLASYGLSVLILICIFLYLLMRDKQKKITSPAQSSTLLGFICALLLGMGEAALFSGGLSVYLFFGIFLATTDEEQRTEVPRALSLSQ